MQAIEETNEPSRKRLSAPAMIVIGIILISAAFLAFPSSSSVRVRKAKETLAKDYAGPKDISYLYGATWVTIRNQTLAVGPTDEMQLIVFAPKPGEVIPTYFFNQLSTQYPIGSGNLGKRREPSCLLAPDPSCKGWTFFSKVWMGMAIQNNGKFPIAESLGPQLISSPAIAVKQLTIYWNGFTPDVQKAVEKKLADNLRIVSKTRGMNRFYQDGHGTNYKIGMYNDIWTFQETFALAHPERQLNR